jgi:GAF domain-containing protein
MKTIEDRIARGDIAVADTAPRVTAERSDFGRVVQLVLTELREVVPFDSASVQELRNSRLVIVAGIGFADLDVILGESFDVDNADSPNGEVVHRRRPLIVRDTDQYRAFRRGLHVGIGIRSWLGVPLLHGEELLGMVAFDKAEADFYGAFHQQKALEYANVIAAALVRARKAG